MESSGDLELQSELGELAQDQRHVRRDVRLHGDAAAGDTSDGEKGRDLVMIVRHPDAGSRQPVDARDGEARGAAALDVGSHGAEHLAKCLDVWFRGRVHEHRSAVGRCRDHGEGFGRGHRGIVGPDLLTGKPAVAADVVGLGRDEAAPELLQDLEVRIDLAQAKRASLGVGVELELAGAHHDGGKQEHGGANAKRQFRLPVGKGVEVVTDGQGRAAIGPADGRAHALEVIENLGDVADVGNVLQRHRLIGEQGRAEHRQDGILVAGGENGPLDWVAAVDEKIGHRGRSPVSGAGSCSVS